MKILHIISTIERGGAETQLSILGEAQVKKGHTVEIVYLKGRPELLESLQARGIKVFSSPAQFNWIQKIIAIKSIIRNKVDVIHAHLPASELVAALTRGRVPLIITKHNTEKLIRGFFSFLSILCAIFVETRAAQCIAITDSVRDYTLANNEWQNENSIKTIHYAADPHLTCTPTRSGFLESINFLTISRLVPQKDIPTMLKAFQIYSSSESKSHLKVIGEGSELNRLEKLAHTLMIDGKVTWFGKTANASKEIQACDVLLLTSKYEGFGLVLLEAMALGRPILAAGNPAVLEVLGSDYPGIFAIGNYEKLAYMMNKSREFEFRKSLIDKLHERLRLFSVDTVVDKIQDVYHKSLA